MAATVDSIAPQLAKTTIADSCSGLADDSSSALKSKNDGGENEAPFSDVDGRRLYIGNLAYATSESQIVEFFSNYNVDSVVIPTNPRNNRPVGYAFVDLYTNSDAEHAAKALKGQSILDRKVSVQFARKPESSGDNNGNRDGSAGGAARRSSQRTRRPRIRGPRPNRSDRRNAKEGGENSGADGDPENVSKQFLPLSDVTNRFSSNKETGGKKDVDSKPRIYRPRRPRGPPEHGVPSKTKVMVANLPYDYGEEQLREMFMVYSPLAVKVALRQIPKALIKKLEARNEPRRGRGFGFVTLESEGMQKKACLEMNGKLVGKREISVKVAIDSPVKDEESNAEPTNQSNDEGEN